MFFEEKKEHLIEKQNIKLDLSVQELLIRIDGMDREIKKLMNELNVTPEQISFFLADKDNFTDENWEELQKQRQLLDEKLKLQKENVPDPVRVKKVQAERNIPPHWLFVR